MRCRALPRSLTPRHASTSAPSGPHAGTRRGTESIRCHPFFWGLNWEALEARELTPPYAELCQNKAKAAKAQFEECERHGACMVLPHSMRPVTPSMEGGNSAVNAAAAAMDRMFDFSAW